MSLGGLRDPRNPEPRHLLAARGRRRCLRGLEGGPRRRGGRQLRPGPVAAVALRELACGAARTCSASARSAAEVARRRSRTAIPRFNDIAAPGEDILSTFPLALTAEHPGLRRTGLLDAAARRSIAAAEGTSFATPQVTRGRRDPPRHDADADARPGDGAPRAERGRRDARQPAASSALSGRDRFTGAGRLDQTAALALLDGRAPAARPLRAQRRRRRAAPIRSSAPRRAGRRDARLLERPRRRVPASISGAGERLVRAPTVSEREPAPCSRSGGPGRERIDAARSRLRRLAVAAAGRDADRYRARAAGWYVLHRDA